MMRFLADENIPRASIRLLREQGHDVSAVAEIIPAATDEKVLDLALRENRIVLTFDRYFGRLVFRANLPSPPGIVYFRFDPESPEQPAEHLAHILKLESLELDGRMTVTNLSRIRQRSLP